MNGDGLRPSPQGNLHILDPLEFLAEFTQHIPPKGAHLIRYYVMEKILRHCGLWCPSSPRAPPAGDLHVHDPEGNCESDSASQEPRELTFVDESAFWATF